MLLLSNFHTHKNSVKIPLFKSYTCAYIKIKSHWTDLVFSDSWKHAKSTYGNLSNKYMECCIEATPSVKFCSALWYSSLNPSVKSSEKKEKTHCNATSLKHKLKTILTSKKPNNESNSSEINTIKPSDGERKIYWNTIT